VNARGWPLKLVIAVPVVVIAVTIAVTWLVGGRSFSPSQEYPQINYGGPVGVPGQVLLAPLRSRPVAGWRINLGDALPGTSAPRADLFGEIGDTAYFAVVDAPTDRAPQTWALGVDVLTGSVVFPPVALGVGAANCFTNGPRRLVCANRLSGNDVQLWVVDTATGAVLHRGATDLRASPAGDDNPELRQVGDYLVASRKGTGTYGIGDQGQPTWTVPGDGDGSFHSTLRRWDFPGDPPSHLAVTKTGDEYTVFSVVDGTVLAEDLTRMPTPVVGGYLVDDDEYRSNRTLFFDEQGAEVGQYEPPSGFTAVSVTDGQLPVMSVSGTGADDGQVVLTNTGVPTEHIAADSAGRSNRFIGGAVFVSPEYSDSSPEAVWTKFDLRSGDKTSECTGLPLAGGDYIGSDGAVVVGVFDRRPRDSANRPVSAFDTTTCEKLWELPSSPMWAIGRTLVRSTPGEISSLVPPR
jgi:hypothetical protein